MMGAHSIRGRALTDKRTMSDCQLLLMKDEGEYSELSQLAASLDLSVAWMIKQLFLSLLLVIEPV